MKTPLVVSLDLHCAGPFSEPHVKDVRHARSLANCQARVKMPMPFDAEKLQASVAPVGWWVTVTSEPGTPASVTVLCGACAELVLDPGLLSAARRVKLWSG